MRKVLFLMIEYADSPSGSLTSYSATTTDLVVSIIKKIKEFRLKHVDE